MSGAIKNMFGLIVGTRKMLIHKLFREDIRQFGRAIADIHSVVKADLSFLDLTSVVEGHGVGEAIRPVGLMLASTDPVAFDTVAAQAMGYHELPIWTTYYAHQRGLGCHTIEQMRIRGIEWEHFEPVCLKYPYLSPATKLPLYDRLTNLANATIFRPRPEIVAERCTRCGDCVSRCPVRCIHPGPSGTPQIDLSNCADCGCCLKVCGEDAITLEFPRWVKLGRQVFGSTTQVERVT
jgi:ferredoxin